MVAIKRIALEGMEDHEIEDVMREVDLLKRLDHPSIVKYEGMLRDADYLNIILEWVQTRRIPNADQEIRRERLPWLGIEGVWKVQ